MGTFLLFLKGLRMKRHLCNTLLNFGRNSNEDKKPLHKILIVLLFTLTEFDNNIPWKHYYKLKTDSQFVNIFKTGFYCLLFVCLFTKANVINWFLFCKLCII